MTVHFGNKSAKLSYNAFKHMKVVSATRKGNLVKYTVKVAKKTGTVYTLTMKVANIGYSKYHTVPVKVTPAKPVYLHVPTNCWVHTSKHFSKKNAAKAVKAGTAVKAIKLVKVGKMTRFELANGSYITGLKSFMQY